MGDLWADIIAYLGQDAFTEDGKRMVEQYSADYLPQDKTRMESRMASDPSLKLLLSSIAFGLGVDCRNIDDVIIWGAPTTLLQYWQMAGRAGRDGRKSKCILYACPYATIGVSKEMKDLISSDNCVRDSVLRQLSLVPIEDKGDGCKCNCCMVCRAACTCALNK